MKIVICITIVCLLMFGCSDGKLNKKMFKKYVPSDTEQLANQCFKLIKEKRTKQASNLFIRQYRTQQTIDSLNKISELVNSGTLKSQEIVGWNAVNWSILNSSGDMRYSKKTVLEYQLDLSGKWLLLTVTIVDDKFIAKINATPLNRPLQEINAFNFKHKPFSQILFLILPILVLLFSLFTLIICCITKLKKRKWLWIIFILFGVARITINWSTGQILWKLTCIQLLIPGIFRQGIYGPWLISFSIPLGAILFWIFKKKITKSSDNACDVKTETQELKGKN